MWIVCASCATQPTAVSPSRTEATDPVGEVPSDLSIEIEVSTGRAVGARAKIEERTARFVLLPDGSLHGESDHVPQAGLRPARVRRLSREQMVDIWVALSTAGFADPTHADARGNVKLLEPQPADVLCTLEVNANGVRFSFVRHYLPGGDDELAMRRLIRSVASLAWASDEALVESAELPLRYDLGPDPYDRFAKPIVAGESK